MPKSPTAIEVPVKDILSSNYLFNIPGYQRPYAWTTAQATELFDDLWDFLLSNPEPPSNDLEALEKASTYFLGSLVLIKEKDRPDAEVIDGQQRLTTLTLLLSCLRASLPTAAGEPLSAFLYEKGNEFARVPPRYRLRRGSRF